MSLEPERKFQAPAPPSKSFWLRLSNIAWAPAPVPAPQLWRDQTTDHRGTYDDCNIIKEFVQILKVGDGAAEHRGLVNTGNGAISVDNVICLSLSQAIEKHASNFQDFEKVALRKYSGIVACSFIERF